MNESLWWITVEIPYNPHVDICDAVTFVAGSRHVMSDVDMIVQKVSHVVTEGNRSTTLECRQRLPDRTPKLQLEADAALMLIGGCAEIGVTLTWEPVDGATSYVAKYMRIHEGVQSEWTQIVTDTTATFGPFPLGSSITFGVAAIVGGERQDFTFVTVELEPDESMPKNVALTGTNGGFTGAYDPWPDPLYQYTNVEVYDPEAESWSLRWSAPAVLEDGRWTFEVDGLTNGVTYDVRVYHVLTNPQLPTWPACFQVTPFEYVPEEEYEPEFRGFYPPSEPSGPDRIAGQRATRDAYLGRIVYSPAGGTIGVTTSLGDPLNLPAWVYAGMELRFPRTSGVGPIGWTVERVLGVERPQRANPE